MNSCIRIMIRTQNKLLPMKTVSQPETIVLNNVQVWTKHAYMWGISKSLVLWFDFVICMNVNKTFSILLVSLHFSCKLNSVDSFIFVDTNFSELRKTSCLISWVFFVKIHLIILIWLKTILDHLLKMKWFSCIRIMIRIQNSSYFITPMKIITYPWPMY